MIWNIRSVSNIRYASIRSMDISNGKGVGVALFVQGCPAPHCNNCFNPETWDFNGGREWTSVTEDKLIELANRPYIKRLSILGGEPLAEENLNGVLHLVNKIRLSFGNSKSIWLYTGYEWDHIFDLQWHYHPQTQEKLSIGRWRRQQIVSQCDVLIDGRFVNSLRDVSLKFRGSSNQRVIDVKKSLQEGKISLYCD